MVVKVRWHTVTFSVRGGQQKGETVLCSHGCDEPGRGKPPVLSEEMPPCLSEPQSQLHFLKIMIVFISLFCIHFQLMLPEKMLETKYLYLTEVELGRDSNVSNALSRGNDNETFQLYCNCTCMPTAFIFTVDIHLGALPFPLFRVCM